jgi:AcrR family transcriptional regulator
MCISYTYTVPPVSTSRRSRYHHGDLRNALLGFALDLAERGEDLTLRALSQRAGVSGMAPYRHFPDKAALLAAVAETGFAMLRQRMVEVDDPSDPLAAIGAFGGAYVGFACERPGLFRVMFGGRPPTPDDRPTADPASVFGLFATRIAAAVPANRRDDAFVACWSLAHGLASLLVAGRIRKPPSDPIELMKRTGRVLLRGLARDSE